MTAPPCLLVPLALQRGVWRSSHLLSAHTVAPFQGDLLLLVEVLYGMISCLFFSGQYPLEGARRIAPLVCNQRVAAGCKR